MACGKTERKAGQQVGKTGGRLMWNYTVLSPRVPWTHEPVQKAGLATGTVKTKPFFSASVAEYFLWCYTIVIHYCCHLCWQLIQADLVCPKCIIDFGTPQEFVQKAGHLIHTVLAVCTWPVWHPRCPGTVKIEASSNFVVVLWKSSFYLFPAC